MAAENTTDCQSADGECHPLSFYVAHSSSYFTDNTIFYFKGGTHTVMDGINITGVQNVGFIGLNQRVIINSKVHHYNPLTIFNSTNISILNITILHVLFFHDDISIVYSQDIFILNVNIFSMSIHDSFEVTVYNTYVYHFYGQFGPSVHCYNTLQFHNLTPH